MNRLSRQQPSLVELYAGGLGGVPNNPMNGNTQPQPQDYGYMYGDGKHRMLIPGVEIFRNSRATPDFNPASLPTEMNTFNPRADNAASTTQLPLGETQRSPASRQAIPSGGPMPQRGMNTSRIGVLPMRA